MSLVRRFARPVLASSFIISGVERLRDPDSTAHIAKALELASATIPQLALVKGQERLVGQAIAAKQVFAASLFALGKFPRLSSAVLVGTGVVNAYIEFAAAKADSPEEKSARQQAALKNVSLLGALALASVDTAGNPSLAWRAGKLSQKTAKKSSQLSADVQAKAEDLFSK